MSFKGIVIVGALTVVGAVAIVIFLSSPISNMAIGNTSLDNTPKSPIQNLSRLHSEYLVQGTWMFPPNFNDTSNQPQRFAADQFSWEFAANNQTRLTYSSDYEITYEGYYRLETFSNKSGIIFIVLQDLNTGQKQPNQVLRYNILNGSHVQIADKIFVRQGHDTINSFSQDGYPRVSYNMINPQNITMNFPIWSKITEKNWTMVDANPNSTIVNVLPQKIEFENNGNYEMTYANGCNFAGTFSILAEAEIVNNIGLLIPERDCDPRGNNESFSWHAFIKVERDTMIFENIQYKQSN